MILNGFLLLERLGKGFLTTEDIAFIKVANILKTYHSKADYTF
jgi:hypothetical protein